MTSAAKVVTVRGLLRFVPALLGLAAAIGACAAPTDDGTETADQALTDEHGNLVCESAIPDTVILDVPYVGQMPELPRGCEVTSLAMVLRYAGIDADKMTLATEVKKVDYEKDGLNGNPYDGFVGDMYTFSKPGLGVYHGPVAALAERYLPGRIHDLTGSDFNDVLGQHVAKKRPVWVITNAKFRKLEPTWFKTWHTQSGDVDVTWQEHSVVITGYDPDFVYINDPLDRHANKKLPRQAFRESWEQMGSQAITYENCGYPERRAGGACAVRNNGRLYCDNTGGVAMHERQALKSPVVNHLRTSYSWFTCWGLGERHAGGNRTWYRTIGDDNAAAGWVPAVNMKTSEALDEDPSAKGLPHCEIPDAPENPDVDGGAPAPVP